MNRVFFFFLNPRVRTLLYFDGGSKDFSFIIINQIYRMALPSPTTEELKLFHSIDRQLYRHLVIDLRRDVFFSMKAIAFWLWLEEIGYKNVVLEMLRLPDNVILFLIDKAFRCISSLESPIPPPIFSPNVIELPATQALMDGKVITLSFLYQHRVGGLRRINRTVNEVFSRVFDDIIQQASPNNYNAFVGPNTVLMQNGNQSSTNGESSTSGNPSIWRN